MARWWWIKYFSCGLVKDKKHDNFDDQLAEISVENGCIITKEPQNVAHDEKDSDSKSLRTHTFKEYGRSLSAPETLESLKKDSNNQVKTGKYISVVSGLKEYFEECEVISGKENENFDNIFENSIPPTVLSVSQNNYDNVDESGIFDINESVFSENYEDEDERHLRKYEYDINYFTTFIKDVTDKKKSIDEVRIEYLRRHYRGFIEKLEMNVIQKFYCQIALLQIRDIFESNTILISDGRFDMKDYAKTKIIKLLSFDNIDLTTKKIRKERAKACINVSQNGKKLIFTIINVEPKCLFLRPRDFNPIREICCSKNYTAFMHPNSEQTKFALEGVHAIARNAAMLKKLWIMEKEGELNVELLCPRRGRGSGIIKKIYEIIKDSQATLICASSNNDVANVASQLLNTYRNLNGTVIRVVTLQLPNSSNNSILERNTKCITQINNLESYCTIICTLGVQMMVQNLPKME